MKKWIILALIIVCLISLVGCRPDKQTPQPNPSGKIERTEEPDTYPRPILIRDMTWTNPVNRPNRNGRSVSSSAQGDIRT